MKALIISTIKSALPDALMVAGAGSISYGVWTVYQPAGIVTGGVFALLAGVLAARGARQ